MKSKRIAVICAVIYAAVCGALLVRDQKKMELQSETCRLCSGQIPEGLYLLGTASGQLYWLDPPKEMTAHEGMTITCGHDAVSGETLEVIRAADPERILLRWERTGTAKTEAEARADDEARIDTRVKTDTEAGIDMDAEALENRYCADCAKKIAATVSEQKGTEFLLFDVKNLTFYAGTEGIRQIGDHEVCITRQDGMYELLVRP